MLNKGAGGVRAILRHPIFMQTFLPYSDFIESAKILDNKRLGKQRVEAFQILKALRGDYSKTGAWENHPATRMWRGYSPSLTIYMNICIQEWCRRGFNNTMKKINIKNNRIISPPWLGDPDFHASHRSNLLRKDPEFYGQYDWSESNELPYVWPI